MSYQIRKAVIEDALEIWEVEKRSWLDTYTNQQLGLTKDILRKSLQGPRNSVERRHIRAWRKKIEAKRKRGVFIAEEQGQIKGFIAPFIEKDIHRLGSLYVASEAQGQGLGSALLQQSLAWHGQHDIYLYVVAYVQKSVDFYKSYGFEELSRGYAVDERLPSGLHVPNIRMVRRQSFS
jgi:GNAT superfamily N-acetyltransferase